MDKTILPRLMLAGPGGDCGKTFVAIGLAAAWRDRGIRTVAFKKGPDYIDAAWLALAAGAVARNLDTWMTGEDAVLYSFGRHAIREGINLIEGNRGLYDGEGAAGAHSSAELSKLLQTPVILVVPAVKATRTVAAIVLGLKAMDPQVEIAGIILNRTANARQEGVIRAAVRDCVGLPVLGAVPRIDQETLSSRHLGLVTPEEHSHSQKAVAAAARILAESVDLAAIKRIAESAPPLEIPRKAAVEGAPCAGDLKIGHFRSPAFTFYYPENLEAIDARGARRIPVDPLKDRALPELDALYIGGGFPETHAALLSANGSFLASVRQAAENGLPIWAECGGLIFLCRSLRWEGRVYPMAGVFRADIALERRPAGHGYEEVLADRPNPFIATGAVLRGHEFHYSRLERADEFKTVFQVKRGTGLGNGRDGLIYKQTVASYLHLHALGAIEWADGLISAARRYRPR